MCSCFIRIKSTIDLLMIAYYKNNNEPMDSVKLTEFYDLQTTISFLKRTLLHEVRNGRNHVLGLISMAALY